MEPEVAPEPVATPKALRTALEYEKSPELASRLAEEAIERDEWAAEISRMTIPKLVQQLALNAYREQPEPGKICLHLRSSQKHLNSPSVRNLGVAGEHSTQPGGVGGESARGSPRNVVFPGPVQLGRHRARVEAQIDVR